MESLTFLNTRKKKEIRASLKRQFEAELFKEDVLVQNNNNDVFLINRDVDAIPLDDLRINNVGLYIGEFKNQVFRPGIEGAQIIGPHAKKNVVDISTEMRDAWMRGHDIPGNGTGYVLLRSGKHFVGCGAAKNGMIKNFVPKARRINAN